MNVIGKTHIGLVRENNQDALEYGSLGTTAQYAVVCDGMGGANGGNIASKIAVEVTLLLGNSIGTQNLILRWLWGSLGNNDLLDRLDCDSGSFGNNCHLLQFLKRRETHQKLLHSGQQQLIKCHLQTDIERRQHNHRCEESNCCTELIIPLDKHELSR